MQVCTKRVTTVAHISNQLTLLDVCSLLDNSLGHVCIPGLPSVPVVDKHAIPVGKQSTAALHIAIAIYSVGNNTGSSRIDWLPQNPGVVDVDALMATVTCPCMPREGVGKQSVGNGTAVTQSTRADLIILPEEGG